MAPNITDLPFKISLNLIRLAKTEANWVIHDVINIQCLRRNIICTISPRNSHGNISEPNEKTHSAPK
ncbi:hypothetical protein PHET_11873 [Paragonimus heterotremus]|uniref:Uncharacterized protein n=1 Tax=Paragonimus heterotremus TaxID=100268 RepID=A0A8J4WCG9_9TREM|nr:hypothetical protein PHET_11873 [Paragonimus heterotremus]